MASEKVQEQVAWRIIVHLSIQADSTLYAVCQDTVYYHYLPLLGVKSYVELATTMAAPRLMGNIYNRWAAVLIPLVLFPSYSLHCSSSSFIPLETHGFSSPPSPHLPPSIGLPRDLNTVNTVAAATCLALHLYNRLNANVNKTNPNCIK